MSAAVEHRRGAPPEPWIHPNAVPWSDAARAEINRRVRVGARMMAMGLAEKLARTRAEWWGNELLEVSVEDVQAALADYKPGGAE